MLSRLVVVVSLLFVQICGIPEAKAQSQPYPGYTDWNVKVRQSLGCDQGNICVGTFISGKPILTITTSCFNSMCPTTPNILIAGNDAIAVYNTFIAQYSQWVNKTDLPRLIFSAGPTSSDAPNLSFTYTISDNNNGGYSSLIQSNSVTVNCTLSIDGLGCADDDLDRTTMDDGPCEICSKIGNPFDVRNGAKYEHAVDLDFPISIFRNYSSKKRVPGIFGLNWRSNFDKTLKIVVNNNIITSLIFTNPNGEYIVLQSNNGTDFNALFKNQRQYRVSIANGQIRLVRPDSGFEIYDVSSSKIISETYKGKTLTYQYNNYGLITRVVDSFGRYLQFSYSGYANVVDYVYASNGDRLNYTYDGGNVSTVSFNDINQITYLYSGALLTGKLNGAGVQYASFSYDTQGRGIENKWITTDGHDIKKYTVSYNNNTATVTQGNGSSRTFTMGTYEYANKISNMNWNGKNLVAGMDGDGNVVAKTTLDGFYENYSYDGSGRLSTISKNGALTNISWDNDRNIAAQTTEGTANGTRTTTYYYDNNGTDLGSKVTGTGGEQHDYKSVDSYGRLTQEQFETGLVKTYTYFAIDGSNQSGLLASITFNTGQTIVINSYDNRGNPTSVTTNGVTKTMTYDYKGRMLTESVAGATNTYTYDIDGNMLTANMATGYQLSMTYDSAGRLLAISDNMGGATSFGIDDYTNDVLNTSITQGNTLVRARNKIIDSLGRTTQTWNATARTKQYTNYGSRVSMPDNTVDANGIQSSYSWNSLGLATGYSSGSDASSNIYDSDGNLRNITLNNQQTTMQYDDFGRITSLHSPDSGNKSFSYSQNQDVYTDSKGTVHTTTKGTGGLPVVVTHNNDDPSYSNYESYQYDSYGRVQKISSNNSELLFDRNALGQLTTKTQTPLVSGFKSYAVQYAYNIAGQKVSDTYPSGLVINYGYTNGFLTSVSAGGTTVVSNVTYNSMLKEPVSWNLGGSQVSISKDADGLITGFTDSGAFNQSIGTDNEGHITSVSDSLSNNNFSVSLTSNYNLYSGSINNKSLTYQFGGNHNLSAQNDGITNYTFGLNNSNNRINSLSNSGVNTNIQYDDNGNQKNDQRGSTFRYDGNNNLEYFTDSNGNMVRYYYNGLGQRIAKWVQGGQLRYFVYNENSQLIGEYDSSGNVINEYVYFGARPVAVKTSSSLNIVHTDYLGTPRVVTSGGSVVWQWNNNNPYGNNIAQGSIEFNLRFTGQYYDSESGLHYNIHRTYDPSTGRYLQPDPIGLAGGFNTYNYVNKNPLNNVDPFGLDIIPLGLTSKNQDLLDRASFYTEEAVKVVGDAIRGNTSSLILLAHGSYGSLGGMNFKELSESIIHGSYKDGLIRNDYFSRMLKSGGDIHIVLDACSTGNSRYGLEDKGFSNGSTFAGDVADYLKKYLVDNGYKNKIIIEAPSGAAIGLSGLLDAINLKDIVEPSSRGNGTLSSGIWEKITR